MKRKKPLLVTFEGTEGAGKTTLILAVEKLLLSSGYSVTRTREPGGNSVAEKIRNLILGEAMDPWTELFLYEAARAEHFSQVIQPALQRGEIVLCDRFTDSTLAYQGHARGLPWKTIQQLNSVATQKTAPHLTVLLDIDPAVGLARARDRNRFEEEGLEFQKKVRQGFLKSIREQPKRWFKVKAQGTPEELAQKVASEMKKRFKLHG